MNISMTNRRQLCEQQKVSQTRTQVMDENIQQNHNKTGTSILETRSGTK